MIEWAGTGVAMANAIDQLKKIADFITLTNNEDGVAEYLIKHFEIPAEVYTEISRVY